MEYAKPARRRTRKASAFASGLLKGLASPSEPFMYGKHTYPHRSTAEALGGDWARIGLDMGAAVQKISDEIPDVPQTKRA